MGSAPVAMSASVAQHTPGRPHRSRWSRGAALAASGRSRTPPPYRRVSGALCTRNTPQRRNAASRTSSLPVCDAAARDAASDRPALMTIMGLLRAYLARGGEKKLLCISHRFHIQHFSWCGDRHLVATKIKSPQPTSSIEPVETMALDPTCSRWLQSRIAVCNAPLWLRKATLPACGRDFAKGRVEPDRWIHETHAIRSNQSHGAPPQMPLNRFFQRCSPDALAESSGNHHG